MPLVRFDFDPDPVTDGPCRRKAPRVAPPDAFPLIAEVDGGHQSVLNISSGGVALAGGDLSPDELHTLVMDVPRPRSKITARIKVKERDDTGIFHCQFVDMPPASAEAIETYVLQARIDELRREGPDQADDGASS